jgi:stage V sporulation protein AE
MVVSFIQAFITCGIICLIAQIILDNTNLTTGHVTSLFVVIGAFLDIFGIYDKIVLYCGAGAIIPITSFGHLLIHGAMDIAGEMGAIGLSFGVFNLTSAGISVALVIAFLLCLIFKPKH